MGDRTTVYITIGGKVSTEARDDLMKALEQEWANPYYFDANERTNLEHFENCCADGTPAIFYADECNWGMVPEVQTVIETHNLDAVIRWDAGSDYSPGETYYKDGVESFSCYSTVDGPALVLNSLKRMTPIQITDWIAKAEWQPGPVELVE